MVPFMMAAMLGSVLSGQGCTKGMDAATAAAAAPKTINIWAVVDDEDVYDGILKDYHALHPNVSVVYRRFRNEEYENELVNALAEDRGPDIFLVHNDWISKYMSKIEPMPPSTKVAAQTVVGTVKKEVTYVLETDPSISIRTYKNTYPDAVAADTIRTVDVSTKADVHQYEQRIVAVPVSVDTLGMYVNKDLLNAAGIATVPTTWDAFQQGIPKLVKQDADGNLLQAGAALGTAYNVDRVSDIVSVLMMQNGAEMAADDGTPMFYSIPAALSGLRDQPPSFQAVGFYTDFADPAKQVYTWNDKQPDSFDAFVQGKVAFYFGYGYSLPLIRASAPKLNLGIAPLPQILGNPTVNFANYWDWTVSKKSKNKDVAWNLLNFMLKPEEAKKYLDAAKRPAADKSLLPAQLEDEDVGVFASQVLTAKSWYRGNDPTAMENAFKTMVNDVLTGAADIPTAVRDAQDKISQTIVY